MEARKNKNENQFDIVPLLEQYFQCYDKLAEEWDKNCEVKFKLPTQSRLFDQLSTLSQFPMLCWPNTFVELYSEFENILELFLTEPVGINDLYLNPSNIIEIAIESWFKKIGVIGYNIFIDAESKKIKPTIFTSLRLEKYKDKLEQNAVLEDMLIAYISHLYQYILGAYTQSKSLKVTSTSDTSNSIYQYLQRMMITTDETANFTLNLNQEIYAMKLFSSYISTHIRELVTEIFAMPNAQLKMLASTAIMLSKIDNVPSTTMQLVKDTSDQATPKITNTTYNIAATDTSTVYTIAKSPYDLSVGAFSYAASWMPTFKKHSNANNDALKKSLSISDFDHVQIDVHAEIVSGTKSPDAEQLSGSIRSSQKL